MFLNSFQSAHLALIAALHLIDFAGNTSYDVD